MKPAKKTVRVHQAPSLVKLRRASVVPVANAANVRRSFVITQLDPTDFTQPDEQFECSLNRICRNIFRKPITTIYTPREFEDKIVLLHKFCLTHLMDSYRIHLNRMKGVALIEEIVRRANFADLKPSYVARLVWSTLSCVHHFYIRLRPTTGPMDWLRRIQAKRAINIYERLMDFLQPDLFSMTLQAILTFFNDANVWSVQNFCAEILKRLIYTNVQAECVLEQILNIMERNLAKNFKVSRNTLRVLYEIMVDYTWLEIDEDLVTRLLTMYFHSINPSSEDDCFYPPLRKPMELLIRAMLRNFTTVDVMKSMNTMLSLTPSDKQTDEAFLEFGSIIEYAATLHDNSLSYKEALSSEVFSATLRLLADDNFVHSLLGYRVLQRLIDRNGNLLQLNTPRIFQENARYDIIIPLYKPSDKHFIRKYREILHSLIIASIEKHGEHKIYLENVYATLSLLIIEIPCGYTAAALSCLCMAIQENTINLNQATFDSTHRIHATVLAVMSLICWIHSAHVFYDYLNEIVTRRAEHAPHLNPPLKPAYQYGQHHILWNKPDLFFEDWEVRYGLWKCFRSRRRGLTGGERKLRGST